MFNNQARWAHTLLCTLFVVTFCAVSPRASAQTRTDVAQVWARMKLISKKGGEELKLVFTQDGKVYTFHGLFGEGLMDPARLFVSVRFAGTKHRSLLSTCGDYGIDGTVDYGDKGELVLSDKDRKYFFSKRIDSRYMKNGRGAEFEKYWQQFYREAIFAAKKHLGIKK